MVCAGYQTAVCDGSHASGVGPLHYFQLFSTAGFTARERQWRDIPTPERGNDQNVRYLFNGDRLAFVKGYQRKKGETIKSKCPQYC